MTSVRRMAALSWTMARYRVAVMLWMFLLLGAAWRGGLRDVDVTYPLAAAALALSYVSATSLNDIADREVDAINHPDSPGRPLVRGDATERDLYLVHAIAAAGSVALAAALGPVPLLILLASLAVNYAYSMGPLRLSYRTYLAPLVLAVGYVLVPYALGAWAAGPRRGGSFGWVLAASLLCLFLARINLKDFRDRVGDHAYGKPTLLLRFGKAVTCLVSLVVLLAGNALLVAALRPTPALLAVLEAHVAAVIVMLYRLYGARDHDAEQGAIGVGAKMGNALLLTVLAVLVLRAEAAPPGHQVLVAAAILGLFGASFLLLWRNPGRAVVGYRG